MLWRVLYVWLARCVECGVLGGSVLCLKYGDGLGVLACGVAQVLVLRVMCYVHLMEEYVFRDVAGLFL